MQGENHLSLEADCMLCRSEESVPSLLFDLGACQNRGTLKAVMFPWASTKPT